MVKKTNKDILSKHKKDYFHLTKNGLVGIMFGSFLGAIFYTTLNYVLSNIDFLNLPFITSICVVFTLIIMVASPIIFVAVGLFD